MSIKGFSVSGVTDRYDYNYLDNKPEIHSIPTGGTAGQVLAKRSGADYAVEWADQTGGGGDITVDDVLSNTSENPVQNKVITAALATKADQASVESTIPPIVNTWLSENVAQETGYVLDSSLTMSNAAAPANLVGDLKSALNATVNYISVVASGETSLYLNVGDKVKIVVESITGTVNAYISGYSSANILALTKTGTYYYTAANAGKLRFYFLSGAMMDAKVSIVSNMGKLVEQIPILQWAALNEQKINTAVGTIDTTNGYEVSNNNRLRTAGYIDNSIYELEFSDLYYAYVYAYDIDGAYIGSYTGNGYTTNWQLQKLMTSPLDVKFFTDSGYTIKCVFRKRDDSAPDIDTLNLTGIASIAKAIASETYTVGRGKDFETFTEMLVSLKENANIKTVYVYGGEYDIFSEMGGAQYIASLDITGKTWRDVCNIVPPNTHIIGVGEVTLLWNPSDSDIIDNAHAFLFSPLNLSGSCTIENINIKCSNCRYGIHDETSGQTIYDNGIVRILKNVNVEYHESTYGTKYAYGAGHNKNSKYRYENCFFSAAYGDVWSMHDWTTGNQTKYESSEFLFENCVFNSTNSSGSNGIRFESSDLIGRTDDVKIVGSTFGRITFGTGGSTAIKQGYKVQTMLCPSYTVIYSSYIAEADRISPTNYLQIG